MLSTCVVICVCVSACIGEKAKRTSRVRRIDGRSRTSLNTNSVCPPRPNCCLIDGRFRLSLLYLLLPLLGLEKESFLFGNASFLLLAAWLWELAIQAAMQLPRPETKWRRQPVCRQQQIYLEALEWKSAGCIQRAGN